MPLIYATSEFSDIKGTDWKIDIVKNIAGADTNLPFNLGPDGFSLDYDFDGYDRCKPIVGSRVQITLYHPIVNSAFFDAMYDFLDSEEEGMWWLKIYRDPDGANELWWVGEILPEQTIIPDDYPNASVTITAVDGLRNLDGLKYNNSGVAYVGNATILTHLHNCLQKLQVSDVWSSTDIELRFFEDFIGSEYLTNIGAGQNKQLENAKIPHSTFYNLDDDGIKQYFSVYEVLESIAMTLNASIFMSQGSFWLVPLGAIQSHASGGLDIVNHLLGDGTAVYNTVANTTISAAFGSNSSQFEKLAGFERTSCPSFKEVRRTRNYQGDKPVVKDSLYERADIVASTILDDEDIEYQSPRKFLVSGVLRYTRDGDGSSINGDKVARLKLGIRLRVGDAGGTDRYLSRVGVFDSTDFDYANFFNPVHDTDENDFFYYNADFPDASWSATAANYEILTTTFNKRLGTTNNQNGALFIAFSFLTPEIPADATGLQLSIDELTGVTKIGANDVDLVDATADFVVDNFQVHVFDEANSQEFGQLDITATNPDDARYKFEQGTTLIGDRITDSDLGTISIFDGTNYVDATQWTNLQSSTASLSINGLGVRERLAANENAKRIERGTLYQVGSAFIHPYTILTNSEHSGNFYQVTGLRIIAARCGYDIECMYLTRNPTGITVAQDNGKGTPGAGLPTVVPSLKGPGAENIISDNNTKLGFVTTDADGITSFTSSKGTGSGVEISIPTSKSSVGKEVVTIDNLGTMNPLTDGGANQFLRTNGAGGLIWDKVIAHIGWHGFTNIIKVMPNEFVANDDYSRGTQFIEDDTLGFLGVRCITVDQELYAFVNIPSGFSATHVQVYASASTVLAVETKSHNHTTGAITSNITGDFNALIDITDITSSATNSLVLKLLPASATTVIYGADITITT